MAPTCLLLLITFIFALQEAHGFYPKVSIVNDDATVSKWSAASRNFDTIAWYQKDTLAKFMENYLSSEAAIELSSACADSLAYLDNGLRQRKLWSYEFIDAFTKGDLSYSQGNVGDLGKLDTCIKIHVEGVKGKLTSATNFQGKYCVVNVNFPVPENEPVKSDPMTAVHLNVSNTNLSSTVYEYYADRLEYFYRESFSFGICVPTTCSREDITSILNHVSNGTQLTVSLRKHCDSFEGRKVEKAPIESKISMAIIVALIILVIFSTAIGILFEKCEVRNKWTFLQHFNAVNSHRKLTEVSTNEAQLRMRPMEAFITIAQIFAVAGHGLVAGKLFPTSFPAFIEYSDNFGEVYILKAYFFYIAMGAQAFFAVAGFFNCYIVYPMMVKAYGGQWPPESTKEETIQSKYKNAMRPVNRSNGKAKEEVKDVREAESGEPSKALKGPGIPFHLFLLKRWLRTIPTLGFMILVTLSTSTFTTNPVVRDAMDKFQDSCRSGWWKSLLMMNNYDAKLSDICILQSWYISADFQLWILSYLPLVFFVKAPKIGILITCLYMIIGCVSTTVVTHIYDLPSFLTGREFELFTFFLFSKKFIFWFLAGYNGLFSYFFGFLIAYHCLTTKKITSIFSFRWIILNGVLLYFCGAILLSPIVWTTFLQWPSVRWFEVLYSAVSRAPFGLFYAFIMINIYYGFYKYLPLMKTLIDTQFWVVVGRLSFSVFLSHILTIVFVYSVFYETHMPSSLTALGGFFIMFELSAFFLAYLMYLIVEAPFASILSGAVKKRMRPGEEAGEENPAFNGDNPSSVGIEMSHGVARKISKRERRQSVKSDKNSNFDPLEGV